MSALINIALCCLGYLPGVLHSWYIIAKYPEVVEIDIERQDILQRNGLHAPVYITVAQSPSPPPQHYNVSYGTVAPQHGHGEIVPPPPPPASAAHYPPPAPSGPSVPAGPPPEYHEFRK